MTAARSHTLSGKLTETEDQGDHHILAQRIVLNILDIVVCCSSGEVSGLLKDIIYLNLKSSGAAEECL